MKLNLIVTAGGTRERIDAVRTITNEATGRLGSLIADELSQKLTGREHTIYYLCGAGAAIPSVQDPSIRVIRIEGTDELQKVLGQLLTQQRMDAVIHSMAVSDYKVKSVAAVEGMAESLNEKSLSMQTGCSAEQWNQIVFEAFSAQAVSGEKKISSELEHPILMLEKTPKIIGMIKKISPQTVLVGFKLLSGVSQKNLIDTGYRLLQKNQCDFVLANDTDTLKNGNHEGFLIDESANFIKLSGKKKIAEEIADKVLNKLLEDKK